MTAQIILVLEERVGDADEVAQSLDRIGRQVSRLIVNDECVCAADELKPDLVIADVSRLGSPTVQTARTLAWVDGIPIVIATALPYLELDRPLSEIPGVRGVLFKPCSDVTMSRALNEALGRLD